MPIPTAIARVGSHVGGRVAVTQVGPPAAAGSASGEVLERLMGPLAFPVTTHHHQRLPSQGGGHGCATTTTARVSPRVRVAAGDPTGSLGTTTPRTRAVCGSHANGRQPVSTGALGDDIPSISCDDSPSRAAVPGGHSCATTTTARVSPRERVAAGDPAGTRAVDLG